MWISLKENCTDKKRENKLKVFVIKSTTHTHRSLLSKSNEIEKNVFCNPAMKNHNDN